MPFQALPLALRRHTGSPLSKLLLIYLTGLCRLPAVRDVGGRSWESAVLDFREDEAAAFCQCTLAEAYDALEELERLRLVYPDDTAEALNAERFVDPRRDRWDFLIVRLPVSGVAAAERSRIKCTVDQISSLREMDQPLWRGACPGCGAPVDTVRGWAVDHVIPRSVGGADVEENCQAICSGCNSRKGNRVNWIDFLGGRRG